MAPKDTVMVRVTPEMVAKAMAETARRRTAPLRFPGAPCSVSPWNATQSPGSRSHPSSS